MDKSIEILELTKQYPDKRRRAAVDHVNLLIQDGELFGLLGPNGAGKTTLIKMLCTLILPSSGTAKVAGHDILTEPAKVREMIGWLHGETGGRALYWRLSGRDNLRFYAYIQNVPSKLAKDRIEALLEFFGLQDAANRLVKDYSTGMKVRVMLARTLLPNPPILLLDEPTVGLDAQTAIETRALIRLLSEELGKTILLTSHNLVEVERLCRRIAIINYGKIIALGTVTELAEQLHDTKQTLELRLEDHNKNAIQTVEAIDAVRKILASEEEGNELVIRLEVEDVNTAIRRITDTLSRMNVRINGIFEVKPSLEEIFVKFIEAKSNADQ